MPSLRRRTSHRISKTFMEYAAFVGNFYESSELRLDGMGSFCTWN